MSWRIHRSVKIVPGVRLNFGKRGTSVSFGTRGARVTVGRNRVTRTVGIPGTGICNTRTATLHKKRAEPVLPAAHIVSAAARPEKPAPARPRRPLGPIGRFFVNALAILSFLLAGFLFLCGLLVLPLGLVLWAFTALFVWLGIRGIKYTRKAEPEPTARPESGTAVPALQPRTIHTKIVGVTRGNRQQYLTECRVGQRLMIKNHPLEKYPHAMGVFTLEEQPGPGLLLGYLPDDLAREMAEPATVYRAAILELTGGTQEKPIRGCNIEIEC